MMEQSTQTNNYERPKKKVGRPKGTALFTYKKTKKEQEWEVGYITLQILKKKEKEND